jgi:ribose/xylose/arabinose/galactoside ABC-type transport system permease subunit
MLIGLGLLIASVGAALLLAGKLGLPLGRLPGDLAWRGKHSTIYFPVVTCIVLSVALSLVFWLLGKLGR